MTIPLIRKRAKRPKVKSGCRTCKERRVKCDEARPSCQRCTQAGRQCAGYETPIPRAGQLVPKLRPKTEQHEAGIPRNALSILPILSSGAVTSWESHALDYFRLNTVENLPGSDRRLPWDRIILPLCQSEPMVVQGAIALGSLHRALATSSISGEAYQEDDHHRLAMLHYGRTIASLRQSIEAARDYTNTSRAEMILVVCLLLFNFDILSDEGSRAIIHLRNGLRILFQQASKPSRQTSECLHTIQMCVNPKTRMDLLVRAFVHFDTEISTFAGNEEIYLSPVCDQPLPTAFLSLEQAQVHLDVLDVEVVETWSKLYDLADAELQCTRRDLASLDKDMRSILAVAVMRTVNLNAAEGLCQRMHNTKQSLVQWMGALSTVPIDEDDNTTRTLVEIHFFYLWIVACAWRDYDEMEMDRFEDQCKHILSQVERYLESQRRDDSKSDLSWSRLTFPISTSVASAICLIIEICRDSEARQWALRLLRSLNMRGVYDSDFLAAYYEVVVELEETAAREILGRPDIVNLRSSQIPAEARVLECDISTVNATRDDYYHDDVGRLVYVMYGKEGQFEVHEGQFHVKRRARYGESGSVVPRFSCRTSRHNG